MPNRKVLIWTVLGFLWGAFFVWYTPLAGPLTDEEIAYYMDRVTGSTRSPDEVAALRRFLESDTGDDFVMVNLIELRERPQQVPGVTPGETASEVLAKYMAYMWPALLTRACHPVIVADAAAPALDLWGIEGAATWTQAAFMRYRSRRDLMAIATDPSFQGPHEFKIAAMAKTVAFPADPWLSAGDPRLLLALVFAIVGLLLTRRRRG
jgi:hypothetical protein